MKVLGIDYGRAKVGLALGDTNGGLAEPWKVVRVASVDKLIKKLKAEVESEQIEKIVVGLSEGKMAEETKSFGRRLESALAIPVVFEDETLTTLDAQNFTIEAGINRQKRKSLEDAYSAALILQNYLETF